jgi:exodeoxyribonuclease VII large subunit
MPRMAATEPTILSVAQLTRRIKGLLEGQVGAVWVAGEISNWRLAASGHAYFTLKDLDSQIDAVMFRGAMSGVRFTPENGMEVLAQGRVTVYEKRGNYQIILNEMQPRGVGALQLAFERLKHKLAGEGLFDAERKRPLPLLPRRIGIVTSPTGAAIRDMLNVLGRRFANVHVLIYPARVQGEGAAAEIVAGIRALDAWGVDVLIVGRGGGSLEDLWPFNEEPVVRAVAASGTPVVSAVGHEIDFTLCDFAADLRAPTPSAAAELVVKERQALVEGVLLARRRVGAAMGRQVERTRHRLAVSAGHFVFARPEEITRQRRQRQDELRMRLDEAAHDALEGARHRVRQAGRGLALLAPAARVRQARERLRALRARLAASGAATGTRARNRAAHAARSLVLLSPARRLAAAGAARQAAADRLARAARSLASGHRQRLRTAAARLDALSPLAILSRGYAVAWREADGALVRDAAALRPGDALRVRFGRGGVHAEVRTVERNQTGMPGEE